MPESADDGANVNPGGNQLGGGVVAQLVDRGLDPEALDELPVALLT